jgi:hypothetical protein
MTSFETVSVDALTLVGCLVTQFAGFIWYSRGLVSKLESVMVKVDKLERELEKDREQVSPIVHTFSIMIATINQSISELKADVKDLKKDMLGK